MFKSLTLALAASTIAVSMPAVAQTASDTANLQRAQDRFSREFSLYRTQSGRQYNTRGRETVRAQRARERFEEELASYRTELDRFRNVMTAGYASSSTSAAYDDPRYDATRDYRDGNYQERVLASDERVYRGSDNQYYCKRNDGSTGLIVGGLGGGVLGNLIGGGGNRTVGSILGAIGGAVAGRAIERGTSNNEVRCR